MNRRSILKRLAVVAGGAALVPTACRRVSQKEVLAAYSNLGITQSENDLVQLLCDIIIPSGDGIKGAKELKVEEFVLVMVNDCYNHEQTERFVSGMRGMDAFSETVIGKKTDRLTTPETEELIRQGLKRNKKEESKEMQDVAFFLGSVKQFTIQGYTTSEYFMTEIMPYEMAPGKFYGKVLIDKNEKVNMYG